MSFCSTSASRSPLLKSKDRPFKPMSMSFSSRLVQVSHDINSKTKTCVLSSTPSCSNSKTKNSMALTILTNLQVLTTHLENMRGRKNQQPNADTDTEEKVKRMGKSNLDKWLQALLVKGMESAGSSPGHCSPRQLLSPSFSHINLIAMRESLERARQQQVSPVLHIPNTALSSIAAIPVSKHCFKNVKKHTNSMPKLEITIQ